MKIDNDKTDFAWYNENDSYTAAWLLNLMERGLIAKGKVDVRSIEEIQSSDVVGTRCHFFAGIGGWDYALQLAGWPTERSVWTGSCPCQPFSLAGQRRGAADERHLWPEWFRLIRECHPTTIFGEQVGGFLGRAWLAAVRADLESLGYAVGIADLCAASVGAPHIRQRLWFVALSESIRWRGRDAGYSPGATARIHTKAEVEGSSSIDGMADSAGSGLVDAGLENGEYATARRPPRVTSDNKRELGKRDPVEGCELANAKRKQEHEEQQRSSENERRWRSNSISGCNVVSELGDSDSAGFPRWESKRGDNDSQREATQRAGDDANFWAGTEWLPCRDGKWRSVEPSTFPLVDGVSFKLGSGSTFAGKSRTKMLKAYGNAIVPQVAAVFIRAFMIQLDLSEKRG